MTAGFLSVLDAAVASGTALLPGALREAVLGCALRYAVAGGGFRGRRGETADLYYTDFGLRLVALLAPNHPLLRETAQRLPAMCVSPQEVVEVFGALNCRRTLAAVGANCKLDEGPLHRVLWTRRLAEGGYRRGETPIPSAYATFLAALCHDLLGEAMPGETLAARRIAELQGPSGGFQEQPGEGPAQSNATAAATAFLTMAGALRDDARARAVQFLLAAQGSDGGLRAYLGAAHGDLLSTFTGLVALMGLDAVRKLDLPAVAHFVRSLVTAEGGFAAWPGSGQTDLEYLYYGLGCLALVAGIAHSA